MTLKKELTEMTGEWLVGGESENVLVEAILSAIADRLPENKWGNMGTEGIFNNGFNECLSVIKKIIEE